MSEAAQLALIQNLPAILAAIAAIIGAIVGLQVKQAQNVTHTLVNGRMDELLAKTSAAAHAEGMVEAQQNAQSTNLPGSK